MTALWVLLGLYVFCAIPVWRRLLGRIYPAVVAGEPFPVFDEVISIVAATFGAFIWPFFALAGFKFESRQAFMARLAVEPKEVRQAKREAQIAELEREVGL